MLYNCLFCNGYLSKRLHLTAAKERILAVNDIHPVAQPIYSSEISGLSNKYPTKPIEAPTSHASTLAVFLYSQTAKRCSGLLWGFQGWSPNSSKMEAPQSKLDKMSGNIVTIKIVCF